MTDGILRAPSRPGDHRPGSYRAPFGIAGDGLYFVDKLRRNAALTASTWLAVEVQVPDDGPCFA